MFVGVEKKLLHCEAGFEIAFNQNGGLKYAGIFGFGKFLGEIPGVANIENTIAEKRKAIVAKEQEFVKNNPVLVEELVKLKQFNPNEAARRTYQPSFELGTSGMTADVGLQINFENWSIHGSLNLYANIAGGLITGVGAQNRAGWAEFYAGQGDWYLHVGTPTNPIGLRMGFGNILAVETKSYFMVGTNIPEAPGVPHQVASILGNTSNNINYMSGLNALQAGNGVAFGSQLHMNTGDLTFLILYARFGAGVGFDIMLKDYGNAQCAGRSGAIGIDGWYANGQAYAYMSGELGVAVNLRFIKKRIAIIKGDVATLMQAQLPNPSFLQAFVAVRFSVLGGLVKGNYKFEVAIGNQCQIVRPGESPIDMELISDVSPGNSESSVSVFAAPQARFAIGVGQQFEAEDDNGKTQLYRIALNEFSLRANGQSIPGTMQWNESRDALSFYSTEVLPSEENVTLTVSVTFEELKSGRWTTVYTGGVLARETKTVSFRTSAAPDHIPLANVEYSYPVIEQRYFLQGESRNGYIQLRQGQNYLFPAGFEYAVAFQTTRGETLEVPFTYSQARRRIEYTLPQLALTTEYSIQILAKSKDAVNVAASTETQALTDNDEQGTLEIEQRRAGQETRTDIGNVLLAYEFGTSRYRTLAEKVQGLTRFNALLHTKGTIFSLGFEVRNMEPFDMVELAGNQYTRNQPLVAVIATLNEPFYTETIRPLLYQPYPVDGNIRITHRNTSELGVPPARAIPVNSEYLTNVENNNFTIRMASERFPYIYDVFSAFRNDFVNIQGQILNRYKNDTGNPLYQRFVVQSFPRITHGNYTINLQYTFPDGTKGTNADFNFYNYAQ
jgi:hypothetical protein